MHLKLYLFKNTLKNYLGRGTNEKRENTIIARMMGDKGQ